MITNQSAPHCAQCIWAHTPALSVLTPQRGHFLRKEKFVPESCILFLEPHISLQRLSLSLIITLQPRNSFECLFRSSSLVSTRAFLLQSNHHHLSLSLFIVSSYALLIHPILRLSQQRTVNRSYRTLWHLAHSDPPQWGHAISRGLPSFASLLSVTLPLISHHLPYLPYLLPRPK